MEVFLTIVGAVIAILIVEVEVNALVDGFGLGRQHALSAMVRARHFGGNRFIAIRSAISVSPNKGWVMHSDEEIETTVRVLESHDMFEEAEELRRRVGTDPRTPEYGVAT